MISYKICFKNTSQNKKHKRERLEESDPNFKEKLLERCIKSLNFRVGSRVRLTNTSKKGIVAAIYYELKNTSWKGTKPFFIEVHWDDGEKSLACPYDLTTKGA